MIVKRPLITEKAAVFAQNNEYVFEVEKQSTKPQIKAEIEKIFNVKVKNVKTIMLPGKTKRVGRARREVKKSDWKKAIVKLEKGQKIDLLQTE